MSYFFKGIDISSIIDTTGTTVVTSVYTSFPRSSTPSYKIERPLELYYTDASSVTSNFNNTNIYDISNRCKAKSLIYNATTNGITIPTGVNYISGYCIGGGGGGGGGGGVRWNGGSYSTGKYGGTGGDGSYVGVVKTTIPDNTNTINIIVGAGGNGGGGGAKADGGANINTVRNGGDGGFGNNGSLSRITIGNVSCTAPGGNGGRGGSGSGGGVGANGTTPAGVIGFTSVGDSTTTSIINYPPQNAGQGGNGGAGGNAPNSSDAGNAGTAGYVVIYYLFD